MKKKSNIRISIGDLIPVIAFVVVFLFFTIASKGKMLSAFNMKMILTQSMQVIVLGCGMLFVVAQGSIDLSVGVNIAVSGILANYIANVTGHPFLLFPAAVLIGLAIGIFNGFIVSKCHVPSFLVSIAMLIGMRGLANYLLTTLETSAVQFLPTVLRFMTKSTFQIVLFFAVIIIVAYVFELTRVGYYCKAIGENEVNAKSIGIPVTGMKWVAFAISGLLAGIGALFSLSSVGGTSMQMGAFMEMKTAMAIFFGGVLVTGGSSAKFYKLILGALTITIIINGLALINLSDSQISESVEGVLLLLILFLTILANRSTVRHAEPKLEDTGKGEILQN